MAFQLVNCHQFQDFFFSKKKLLPKRKVCWYENGGVGGEERERERITSIPKELLYIVPIHFCYCCHSGWFPLTRLFVSRSDAARDI